MKRILFITLVMIVVPTMGQMYLAFAQNTTTPPKVLRIVREEVKPYLEDQHAKIETAWSQVYAKAKWPYYSVGMTSITGPSEAWWLAAYDSYAAIEKENKDVDKHPSIRAETGRLAMQDKELLRGARTMLATFREDLSYQYGIDLSKVRYFRVNTIRVRPGLNDDFFESRKMINSGLAKGQVDAHFSVYQVISGAPAGTFLVFTPMKSMSEMDPSANPNAFNNALGEANRKALAALTNKAIISNEPAHFAINAGLSYVSKEIAAGDPSFWNPKPKLAPKPKPAVKKEEKKAQ